MKRLAIQSRIQSIAATLPELPDATRARLQVSYSLPARDIDVLLGIDNGNEVADDGQPGQGGAVAYFDAICDGIDIQKTSTRNYKKRDPKIVSNW